MAVVRLGLVGAGGVARLYAQAALGLPDEVRVTAVSDIDPGRAAELAAFSSATAHDDHLSMLGGAVDALVVCTPHALHVAPAVDAAAAGVHVLMEKPMATSLAGCDTMAAACSAAGVVLFVGHIQHYLPITATARRAIADGLIGTPVAIVDRRSTDYRPGHRPGWFFDPELAGGGAIMNIGAHGIDRAAWLAGGRPTRVHATVVRRAAVETEGLLQLELDNGVLATVAVLDSALGGIDEIEVLGTAGTLRASRPHGVQVATGQGVRTLLRAPADMDEHVRTAFTAQLTDFAAAVRGERPAAIGAQVGRDVVATVLAAYDSARSGKSVEVELFGQS
ncbi:Gfo/Idh/MocA family protein [Nonomuraea gerenzanensis]|uniref:Gfo/Idh/MocA family protein n=1 Tax=Nonomuraea gerenzanensis TaxID=93944 RepID=UPI001CD9E1FE|nr:Gfo/Idh/MocA family oxidoreductase [Nonomuraea gerenzanensis]UBU18358.1 Gfo/Idh/MocA family oxidoreductase [Nonomuraea gerenzanensis]